jgi:hypothetical protein
VVVFEARNVNFVFATAWNCGLDNVAEILDRKQEQITLVAGVRRKDISNEEIASGDEICEFINFEKSP